MLVSQPRHEPYLYQWGKGKDAAAGADSRPDEDREVPFSCGLGRYLPTDYTYLM